MPLSFVKETRHHALPTIGHAYLVAHRDLSPDPKASKKDREKALAEFTKREKAYGNSGAEWVDVQYGTGKLKIGIEYVQNRAGKLAIDDFELLQAN
jgi:hypothetical protein